MPSRCSTKPMKNKVHQISPGTSSSIFSLPLTNQTSVWYDAALLYQKQNGIVPEENHRSVHLNIG